MKFANIVVGILTISANQKEKSEPSSKTEAQTLIWRISYLRLATYNLDSDELMTDSDRTYKRLTKDADMWMGIVVVSDNRKENSDCSVHKWAYTGEYRTCVTPLITSIGIKLK